MAVKSKSPSKLKDNNRKKSAVTDPVVADKVTANNPIGKENMSDVSIIEYASSLDEAEAPVPLPAGDYPAEIRGVERKTSGKGNEYINVTFFISPENYPADYTDGSEDGAILSYGRLSPDDTVRARYGMKRFAEAIGAKTSTKQVDLNEWIGCTAIVTVVNDTYEGMPTAQIKKVNPA